MTRFAGAAEEFFTECITPFEMALRGFEETIGELRRLNQALAQQADRLAAMNKDLEREIAERRRVEAALEMAEKSKPDLLLTDIMMPHMDGVELARRIKSRYPDTPVILMTGQGSLDTAIASLELGADAYVMKPLDWDHVVASIQAALE